MNPRASMASRSMFWWCVLITGLLIPVHTVRAGNGTPSLRLNVGLSTVYDDNILRYSTKYLQRFDNRLDEGRFHINSRDDMILVSLLRVAAKTDFFDNRSTTAAMELRRRTFTHNSIKDWSYFSASLRQELTAKTDVQIFYNYIPRFYIHHYRDDDWAKLYGYTPATFQSFDYKKDEIGGWMQYRVFQDTRVRAIVSYSRFFYNEHFTEYDAHNRSIGVEVFQSVGNDIRIDCRYDFLSSSAKGNPEDTDPSYNESAFLLGAEWRLPKFLGRRNSIQLEGEYARRFFTTRHFLELDRLHAGRHDNDYRVTVGYTVAAVENLEVGLRWSWHQREALTSAAQNAGYLADEKNYRQSQLGLELRYSFALLVEEEPDF